MNYYVPGPNSLRKYFDLSDKDTQQKIKELLYFSHFDTQWYYDRHKDIQDNVVFEDNAIKSHFILSGFWEGRLPFKMKINKNFIKKHYSLNISDSKYKRMDCYNKGALTTKVNFDLKFYNEQFSHKENYFEDENKAFSHFLKIGYLKLKLPYDIQKSI